VGDSKRLATATVLAALSAMPLVGASCSSAQTLEGQGGTCFQTTDCQLGLACVPQKNGARICSSDLTPIQMVPMNGADAAAPDATPPDANAVDGTTPADTSPPVDTGSPPDTGSAPETSAPGDTGSPQEASSGNESGTD
jgi:hypothetical protein